MPFISGDHFYAATIREETYAWLKTMGCETLIPEHLIDQYAMEKARWIQAEEGLSKFGLVGADPKTKAPITNKYIDVSEKFQKLANSTFYLIYQIVKENASVKYTGSDPQDDIMEGLLRQKAGA